MTGSQGRPLCQGFALTSRAKPSLSGQRPHLRHCEERSDAAIHLAGAKMPGLGGMDCRATLAMSWGLWCLVTARARKAYLATYRCPQSRPLFRSRHEHAKTYPAA